MSDLIKNALANMQAKRIKRIEDAAKRSRIPDIATYQGKSTIDGTDMVQVGSNEPTSGFRLISNAPLSVGEKVSLRPSAIGGLQRVDARNRPVTTQEPEKDTLLSLLVAVPVVGLDFGNIGGFQTFFNFIDNTFSSPSTLLKIGFNTPITLNTFKNFELSSVSNLFPSEYNFIKTGSRVSLSSSKEGITDTVFVLTVQFLAEPEKILRSRSKGIKTVISLNGRQYKFNSLWDGNLINLTVLEEIDAPNANATISFSLY